MSKIFGIGLSKTGTNSLTIALKKLGYDAVHARRQIHLHRHEASTDIPVAARYKQLDAQYPGSKFIVTYREIDSWLESCSNHFRTERNVIGMRDPRVIFEYAFSRGAIYGVSRYDEDAFRAAYKRHHRGINEYFKDRPDDVLWLNIVGGEGWAELCAFLNKPVPNEEFPHRNQRSKKRR